MVAHHKSYKCDESARETRGVGERNVSAKAIIAATAETNKDEHDSKVGREREGERKAANDMEHFIRVQMGVTLIYVYVGLCVCVDLTLFVYCNLP